jgi:hypothetical protein
MPKYRQLHTKIINSFDFNEMPDDFTRVVWLLLTLILDSEGRGIDNMNWVKSNMFPLRTDVDTEQLQKSFDWLANRRMVALYQVNGRKYFYVPTFKNYQSGTKKEAQSLLPPPTEILRSSSGVTPEEVGAAASASESALNLNIAEIFKNYEDEIVGTITKSIQDEILSLVDDGVPASYFKTAFTQAAKNNKRSWAYALAIIKRLMVDGPSNGNGHKKEQPKGHFEGEGQERVWVPE